MGARWLFLAAYTCSGMAGLIYQVTWTRLFGLHLGHSTAAASAVLAAFMGGLCGGAVIGGRLAGRLSPRQALRAYAVLELIVVASALAVPVALGALAPSLRAFYGDGSRALVFESTRVLLCTGVLLRAGARARRHLPDRGSLVRPHRSRSMRPTRLERQSARILTGFVLLPSLGHTRTIFTGAVATTASAAIALVLARRAGEIPAVRARAAPKVPKKDGPLYDTHAPWVGMVVLAFTGFSTFVYEIAWMRLFAMVIGPSTYAFSATVSAFIVALAIGSVLGTFAVARARRPAAVLALALTIAAISALWASSYAGTALPRRVADDWRRQRAHSAACLRCRLRWCRRSSCRALSRWARPSRWRSRWLPAAASTRCAARAPRTA